MDTYGNYSASQSSNEAGSDDYSLLELSEPYRSWNDEPTVLVRTKINGEPIPFPPPLPSIVGHLHPQEVPENREMAKTYAKRALRHFNSVEDTQFDFTGLISLDVFKPDVCKPDTWEINFYACEPEKGLTAVHFAAQVVQGKVHGCGVCGPCELISELHVKHAISKYNVEKGAAYEVVEILRYHDCVILGNTRYGHWNHYNFTAVSRSSSYNSPVLFFAEVNAVTPLDPEEIACCIVDPQHPDATYDCEICPRGENICHPSRSPVGGFVRGPEFAASHHDGSDIVHCCGDVLDFS